MDSTDPLNVLKTTLGSGDVNEVLQGINDYMSNAIDYGEVTEEHAIMALMSAGLYKGNDDAFDALIDMGYTIDGRFSEPAHAVFVSPDGKKAYLVFRGTEINATKKEAANDVITDITIVTGHSSWTPKFFKSRRLTNKVIKAYGKDNVTLVGHSLGGSLALHNNIVHDVPAVVFNPGVGSELISQTKYGVAKKILLNGFNALKNGSTDFQSLLDGSYNNATIYMTPGDIVSTLAPFTTGTHVVYIPVTSHNAHTIKNFVRYDNFTQNPSLAQLDEADMHRKKDA